MKVLEDYSSSSEHFCILVKTCQLESLAYFINSYKMLHYCEIDVYKHTSTLSD